MEEFRIFYSASANAFFSEEVHGSDMPADVVETSREIHAELMAAQGRGQEIAAGPHGPVARDRQPPPRATSIAGGTFRARFTLPERMAWTNTAAQSLAAGDALLRALLDDANSGAMIALDDELTRQAMDQLVSAGALQADRLAEILA